MKVHILNRHERDGLAGQDRYMYLLCRPADPGKTGYMLVLVQEGTGDNLLKEDIDEGYRDYVNYSVLSLLDDAGMEEQDGGMMLLRNLICETENGLLSCAEQAALMAGVSPEWEIMVL